MQWHRFKRVVENRPGGVRSVGFCVQRADCAPRVAVGQWAKHEREQVPVAAARSQALSVWRTSDKSVANTLAFTVARGVLFAEALCPENTYVDPGFTGSLYTTVTNVSNRAVSLSYGMPLARVFFYRLTENVHEPYRSGASLGIDQQLSSVRAVPVGRNDECKEATDKQLLDSIRQIPLGGLHVSECVNRFFRRQVGILAFAAVWPVLLLFANRSEWVKENVGTFIGNVLASIVAALLLVAAPWVWSRFLNRS